MVQQTFNFMKYCGKLGGRRGARSTPTGLQNYLFLSRTTIAVFFTRLARKHGCTIKRNTDTRIFM